MPTTELTPEILKQFIEDVEKITYLYLNPSSEEIMHKTNLEVDEKMGMRVYDTLKILKHVYLKESLVK